MTSLEALGLTILSWYVWIHASEKIIDPEVC